MNVTPGPLIHPALPMAGGFCASSIPTVSGGAVLQHSHMVRRRGPGKLVNAAMLDESHALFGWMMAKEQVLPDNTASQAMIEACGLHNRDGYVSIAAINSDEGISR